jgi:CheY-like chemotaxis protein
MEHVLLVDDEEAVRNCLADFLSDQGYRLSVASSEEEALSLAGLNPPDLVVADMVLSEGSGLSLLKKLKERKNGTENPFCILITGHGTVENAVEALRCGVDDFLTKPFTLQELRQALSARGGSNPRNGGDGGNGAWLTLKRLRHELAAPSVRMVAYADMLGDGLFGSLTPAQAAKVESMRRTLRRMARTLAAAPVPLAEGFPRPRLERMNPEGLLKSVMDEFHLDFERRGVGITHRTEDQLPLVLADRQGVHSALEHLLSNLLLRLKTGSTLRLWWEVSPESLTLRLRFEPVVGDSDPTLPPLDGMWLEQAGMTQPPVDTDGDLILRFIHIRAGEIVGV